MLTSADISKFYEDVQRLGLRSPVADIARATGMSKGPVSEYLAKKKVPSENFIRLFYEKFAESLATLGTKEENPGDVRIAAELSVVKHAVAELLSATSGKSVPVVLAEMDKAAAEIVRLKDRS